MPITFLTPESRSVGQDVKLAQEEKPVTLLDTFLSTYSPMQAGRVRKTLERQQGFSGVFMRRHEFAEQLAAKPGARPDFVVGRVYLSEQGNFYAFKDVTRDLAIYLAWLQS